MKNLLVFSLSIYCFLTFTSLSADIPNNQANPRQVNGNDASSSIPWQTNYADAAEMSRKTNKPIFILFTGTNWCPACMDFERKVLKDPLFVQPVSKHFIFLKAEFTKPNDYSSPYKSLQDRYNVSSFPSIVVTDSNGQRLFNIPYQPSSTTDDYLNIILQSLEQAILKAMTN